MVSFLSVLPGGTLEPLPCPAPPCLPADPAGQGSTLLGSSEATVGIVGVRLHWVLVPLRGVAVGETTSVLSPPPSTSQTSVGATCIQAHPGGPPCLGQMQVRVRVRAARVQRLGHLSLREQTPPSPHWTRLVQRAGFQSQGQLRGRRGSCDRGTAGWGHLQGSQEALLTLGTLLLLSLQALALGCPRPRVLAEGTLGRVSPCPSGSWAV